MTKVPCTLDGCEETCQSVLPRADGSAPWERPHPIDYVMQAVTIPQGVTALEDIEALPGEQRGDCLRAAVASLFGLALTDVPHFVAYEDWWDRVERFMWDRNLSVTYVLGGPTIWHTPYLASGKSPRGDFKHVVVERNGDLIHDPHPSGAGLDGPREGVYLLTPLDHRILPLLTVDGGVRG